MSLKNCLPIASVLMFANLSLAATLLPQEDVDSRYSTDNVVLKVMEQRNVPCRVPGIIARSEIVEGKLLNIGDAVMSIDDRKSALEVMRLEKELEKTRKEASSRVELEYQKRSIEVAQAELNRALLSNQRLSGSVTRSEIDQLNLMVQKAIAEREKIEFQINLREMSTDIREIELRAGKQRLKEHEINAPLTGMVVEIMKRPGEWVEMSEPVCRMIRLDKLRAEVKVPADIALNNLEGSEAIFVPKLDSIKDRKFSARVIFVEPEANPVSSDVKVWIEIDNKNLKLVPGLTGSVAID